MLKKIKGSKKLASYMEGVTLAVTEGNLRKNCFGILGEPELPLDLRVKEENKEIER